MAGKAGGCQRLGQLRGARNPHRLAVQQRAATALGGEELVPQRVVDDRGYQSPVLVRRKARSALLQTQRDAKLRKAVGEVGGSVQRVHVPSEFAFKPVARAFFAVDSVLRKGCGQPLTDQLLRGAVSHRH